MMEKIMEKIERDKIDKKILISILKAAGNNKRLKFTQQQYFHEILKSGSTEEIDEVQRDCYDTLQLIEYNQKDEKTYLTVEEEELLKHLTQNDNRC